MEREELVEQLSQDVLNYVMHGKLSRDEFSSKIKPDELDDRFDEYENLVDLHFILQKDVIDFVRKLDIRLRRVKTQTKNTSHTRRGRVDGRINWSKTIELRNSRNPDDKTLFICDNRTENYDIDENIVLRKLLSVIYNTLEYWDDEVKRDYDWVESSWKENEDLIDDVKEKFRRNVHVNRIRSPEEYEPTERMLSRAQNSRQDIYREAAQLLLRRKELHAGEKDRIQELLEETAITPDDEETLLELYVLFRYISTLENLESGELELKTIRTDKQEIAQFTGNKDLVLYHDNSARDRDLSFKYDLDDDENAKEPYPRPVEVQEATKDVVENYFEEGNNEYSGRPDVIVLEIVNEDENEYLITEVKNSARKKTIRQGIKETLEYLAFMRNTAQGEWKNQDDSLFGSGYNGVLVIQDREDGKTVKQQEEQEIKILQAGQLKKEKSQIGELLQELIKD
jgi:hypothetical protein